MKIYNTEKYNTILRDIEEDANTWRNILCAWIGGLNNFKVAILLIYVEI